MPAEATILAAFLVGLLGGVHCIGMCGGIVGALTLGVSESVRSDQRRLLPYVFAYNLGRIVSYTAAGALVGGITAFAADLTPIHQARTGLKVLAGGFMVALGMYLAGWWMGVQRLERIGAHLWRRIEPRGRRLLPVSRPHQALVLGLFWGWLPCGLVYSVLIWSATAGGAWEGGLLMLGFGLGTLPLLMAMGASVSHLGAVLRRGAVRAVAGLLVAAYGAYLAGSALWALVGPVGA